MAFNTHSFRLAILICISYLNRHRKGVILGLILISILIFIQAKFNLFYKTNTIRIGIIGTYQEHDLPGEVTKLLSQSLVEADSTGKIIPNLVSGWETSSDATSFKLKLKEDLTWADNTKIISSDISFNVPEVEINTQEPSILQFKLKDSYSPLPSLLVKPIFKKDTLLGTGPYSIKKVEKSKIFITKLILEPKDQKLPKVYIRFYPNEKVAQTGLSLGEVQVLLGFPNPGIAFKNPKARLNQSTDWGKIVTILYNTKDQLLSNRSLRQALSYKSPEIEGFEVANNPYPKTLWAYDPQSKKYLNNPKDAEAALERAKSSLDEALKKELVLTTTPNLEDVAKRLVEEWGKLNFNVKIRIESGIPQNFQILLITQSIPADPDQYFLWHSTQDKTNLSKYSSARVDKDLEDGRKTSNEGERKEKYFDFQKTLLEDAPATFLYFPKYNIIYLKKAEKNLKKLLPLQFPN